MCLVCDRIKMIKEGTNPYFVREMETGYVVIGDHQHFKGYTLFLYKEHKRELFDLEPDQKLKYLEGMSVVAQAAARAFHADKMNYELLGNGDTHLHWHLFPRKAGDLGKYGQGPVWWLPREEMYDDSNCPGEEELEEMKKKLAAALEELL